MIEGETGSRVAVSVRGHADGFYGAYVVGWATNSENEICRITIHGSDGKELASGLARRKRIDLAVLGGRTDIGFRIFVPDLGGSSVLHILANGIELPNSPLPVGPDWFDGDLQIQGAVASGWVRARTPEPASPLVTLHTENGSIVGSAVAHYVVDENDPPSSRANFRIEIADSMFGIEEFTLVAWANGHRFAAALGSLRLDGYLDLLDANSCAGWLICPAAPERQLQLEIIRDSTLAGKGRCTVPRSDLRELHPVGWNNGFSIALKPLKPETAKGLRTISIRTKGGSTELLGGPHLLGERYDFIAVARGLTRLSHLTSPTELLSLSYHERAVLQEILRRHLVDRRHGPLSGIIPAFATGDRGIDRSIDIVIPIYKGIDITEGCIRSVLAVIRSTDRLILVADCPPEAAMPAMLERFRTHENVVLLHNDTNRGFVGSVNRGLNYSRHNDVLLLNSDTRMFEGGLEEMRWIMHSADDVGTVTALSNNATIFSYPHPALPTERLGDISWEEIARITRDASSGGTVDVPTGHGFCMMIRREVLDRIGNLNETFGKGYGEENELCLRATDLGFRHVAALGVFVEHLESVSFGDSKELLILENLPKLERMYPEYTPLIMYFEAADPLRCARWPIDIGRLRAANAAGTGFVLIVQNWLGGGTGRALSDIGEAVGYDGRTEINIRSTKIGTVELECKTLRLRATFLDTDGPELERVLDAAGIDLVVIHQLLGFGPNITALLGRWSSQRRSIAYIHDFYAICPRVTLIDAVDSYCGVQPSEICDRCVSMGGGHEASRLTTLTATQHREMFGQILSTMHAVVAPSGDAALHINRAFPELEVHVVPHPESPVISVPTDRPRDPNAIALLGGIGPHKGADKLLELARMASLSHPDLRFHVIGHTSLDEALEKLPNVSISGKYDPDELPDLIIESQATIALFLHIWPETYSYTFSEAVAAGMLPVVPDIGAPAERVRATGWGRIFTFPMIASELLKLLADCALNAEEEGPPLSSFDTTASIPKLREWFHVSDVSRQDDGADCDGPAAEHHGNTEDDTAALGSPTDNADRSDCALQ